MLIVFIHAMLFWKVFDQQGSFPHDILAVPPTYHGDNFTIPLSSLTGILMFICIALGGFYMVRRSYYEIFYYLHHFTMVIFIVMLWHAAMAWYYILPGLLLWTFDYIIRMKNSLGIQAKIAHLDVEGSGNIISLGYSVKYLSSSIVNYFFGRADHLNDTFQYSMGQYCFINIPAISSLEWHPFSISSSSYDVVTTHHIKSMGVRQWTGKLLDLAYEFNGASQTRLGLYDIQYTPRYLLS